MPEPHDYVGEAERAAKAVAHWREIIERSEGGRRRNFEYAAKELMRLAKQQPAERQVIVDELARMGEAAGLDVDDVQAMMAKAAIANGGAKPAPATARTEHAPAPKRAPRAEPIMPAAFLTPAEWPNEAPPAVEWLATQRIPCGEVTSLHGDGGAGKTDIMLQLAANCARGASAWLGLEIVNGLVVVISAEEAEREIRRRIWLHAQRDGYKLAALNNLHLWFPGESGESVMATADHSGVMRPTALFASISAAIAELQPVLVAVDNVAATFAGSQLDRVMARSFNNLWRAIARGPGNPAVLLLDHPSLSGLTSGTGRGGNMDWRNAPRSALYLRPADDKAEADIGIRVLETVKSNYAPSGPKTGIRLCWQECGLALEHAPSPLHRLAKDQECEETFMRLLDERNAQGRRVYHCKGRNYAPAIFAEMLGNNGYTSKAFAQCMERLFQGKKIVLSDIRVDGKPRQCIDRAAAPTAETDE